jgi:soluble lytic murein transglycosylase
LPHDHPPSPIRAILSRVSTRPAVARAPRSSVSANRRAAARKAKIRRRRLVAGATGLARIGVLALVLAPTVKHAVREFELPLQHEDIIRQQAQEKRLDPALIAAVIYAESKFSPRQSQAGAEGLMQLLPSTAEFLAKRTGGTAFVPADLATPQVNIAYGSYYLRYLLDRYHGRKVPAIAAYNAGETNVDHWLGGGRTLAVSSIPYPETRAYVTRVLNARDRYRREYRRELGIR